MLAIINSFILQLAILGLYTYNFVIYQGTCYLNRKTNIYSMTYDMRALKGFNCGSYNCYENILLASSVNRTGKVVIEKVPGLSACTYGGADYAWTAVFVLLVVSICMTGWLLVRSYVIGHMSRGHNYEMIESE